MPALGCANSMPTRSPGAGSTKTRAWTRSGANRLRQCATAPDSTSYGRLRTTLCAGLWPSASAARAGASRASPSPGSVEQSPPPDSSAGSDSWSALRHRKLGSDHGFDAGTRRPQRCLDFLGRVATCEGEPEIRRALRKRNDLLAQVRGDDHVFDQRHATCVVDPAHLLEHAAPTDGQHEHTGRAPLPRRRLAPETKRVPEDQLLQRHADAEAQRPPAQAADAPCSDLEDSRPGRREAQLRVYRTFYEPERRATARDLAGNGVLQRRRLPRRSDVERFLEVRAVERVRLVEEGEHVQVAAHQ